LVSAKNRLNEVHTVHGWDRLESYLGLCIAFRFGGQMSF